ncbi:MAG: cation:proton antiporter [Thermoleophilaceae bacterium]|nr:cation:proton antiporter [Thermoleophilaceae bacterium]
MEAPSFDGLLLVVGVAFAAPFLLGLFPRVRLPAIVLEIVAGIVIGPSVLGWVEVDQAIEVLSLIGLAFLLFLAGLEIEFEHLRGRLLRLAGGAWIVSFGIAVVVGFVLSGAGLVETPLLVGIILSATSLGVIIPVLKDGGEISSGFGQLVVAAGSIADFGAIIVLSLFFSGEGGVGSTLILLGGLLVLLAAVYLFLRGAERLAFISADLLRLQDTTSQIRVRGAVVLLIAFAAVAERLGLEVILGTFAAGALLTLIDRDEVMTHPQFRRKLEAMGFGIFIPVFFVTTGLRFDLDALLASVSTLIMVPIFLLALLVVRGLPAVLYRGLVGGKKALIAGIFQATSLPFIVAATAVGLELGLVDEAESAGLIAAGLLSVLIFPLLGLTLLRGEAREPQAEPERRPEPVEEPAMGGVGRTVAGEGRPKAPPEDAPLMAM